MLQNQTQDLIIPSSPLTQIRPAVLQQILSSNGKKVTFEIRPEKANGFLRDEFRSHIREMNHILTKASLSKKNQSHLEKRLLDKSHAFVSLLELKPIYDLSPDSKEEREEIEVLKLSLQDRLADKKHNRFLNKIFKNIVDALDDLLRNTPESNTFKNRVVTRTHAENYSIENQGDIDRLLKIMKQMGTTLASSISKLMELEKLASRIHGYDKGYTLGYAKDKEATNEFLIQLLSRIESEIHRIKRWLSLSEMHKQQLSTKMLPLDELIQARDRIVKFQLEEDYRTLAEKCKKGYSDSLDSVNKRIHEILQIDRDYQQKLNRYRDDLAKIISTYYAGGQANKPPLGIFTSNGTHSDNKPYQSERYRLAKKVTSTIDYQENYNTLLPIKKKAWQQLLDDIVKQNPRVEPVTFSKERQANAMSQKALLRYKNDILHRNATLQPKQKLYYSDLSEDLRNGFDARLQGISEARSLQRGAGQVPEDHSDRGYRRKVNCLTLQVDQIRESIARLTLVELLNERSLDREINQLHSDLVDLETLKSFASLDSSPFLDFFSRIRSDINSLRKDLFLGRVRKLIFIELDEELVKNMPKEKLYETHKTIGRIVGKEPDYEALPQSYKDSLNRSYSLLDERLKAEHTDAASSQALPDYFLYSNLDSYRCNGINFFANHTTAEVNNGSAISQQGLATANR